MAQTAPVADPSIMDALKKAALDFTLYAHPDFSTCERSAAWHVAENQPGQRVKNLFLRNKNGTQHFLLLLPHDIEFDKTIFKAHSTQKCGLASNDRLKQYLQIEPGCVSPLNLIYDTSQHVQVFIEQSLLNAEVLHFHVGSPDSSVTLKPNDLVAFLQVQQTPYQVIDWLAPSSPD